MKFVTVVAAGLLAVVAQTENAQARTVLPQARELAFVSPTKMVNGTQQSLSLCHMTRKSHLFGLGLWRSSIGYVLSPDACRSVASSPVLIPQEILTLQQAGQLSRGVPLTPRLSRLDLLTGFLLPLLALTSSGAGAWVRLRQRSSLRHPQNADALHASGGALSDGSLQSRLIDVMCQASCAKDQRLSPAKCQAIARIATALTDTPVTPEQIARKYGLALRRVELEHLRRYGDGLSRAQRRTLLTGAIMVTEFRDTKRAAETQFVLTLTTALGLSTAERRACRVDATAALARTGPLGRPMTAPPAAPANPVRRAMDRRTEPPAPLPAALSAALSAPDSPPMAVSAARDNQVDGESPDQSHGQSPESGSASDSAVILPMTQHVRPPDHVAAKVPVKPIARRPGSKTVTRPTVSAPV